MRASAIIVSESVFLGLSHVCGLLNLIFLFKQKPRWSHSRRLSLRVPKPSSCSGTQDVVFSSRRPPQPLLRAHV